MTTTFKTIQFSSKKPKTGVRRYIKETEISGSVIETKISEEVPETNRGTQKTEGWLGSFSSGGCTKDHYSRGLCEIISAIPCFDDTHYEIQWKKVD
jgi:hypothetical protein